ncbi:sugar kinase [Photobacterium sp. J15]|uniref:sugar kinase n=1 Tax=Photobacterium sp. J15 TaxID=265901 RepID=UPI0007E4A755|nr:sugar kinase [Photobacterium sp. J15]
MATLTTAKHKKVAIIGECMIELSGKPFAAQAQHFGGDTLNTAVYLSRLLPSLAPGYITAVGTDSYSKHMLSAWLAEGLDTDMVLENPDKLPGMYAIEIDDDGERSFHYWRSDSAARYLCEHPRFDQLVKCLKEFDLVYLSGISLAILPDGGKLKLLDMLAELKTAGVQIAVDSNYRPRLWQSSTHACEWLGRLYQLSDIALVTADDEDLLLGTMNSSPEVIARRLHSLGIRQVVVKLGSKGAMWSQYGHQGFVSGNRVETVVDTTAAGDSFNAAWLAAWCTGMEMAECCHWGNKLAATVIQHKGAIIPVQETRYITELMGVENDE